MNRPAIDNRSPMLRFLRETIIPWLTAHPLGSVLMGIVLWAGAMLVILDLLIAAGTLGPMPDEQALSSPAVATASEVYSADGQLLGRYFLEERAPTVWDSFPSHLIDALLATEDIRFYEHQGIDDRGLLRAFTSLIRNGDARGGGGSTLTQQLAKNLFPRQSYPFASLLINKLREFRIAKSLERRYTKEEILTQYLNTVFWGNHAYGILVASQRYFGKGVSTLAQEEAALLVAMLKGPTAYNPLTQPQAALARRNLVLSQMVRYGNLSALEADSLAGLPLGLDYHPPSHHAGPAPYFMAYLRQTLKALAQQQVQLGEHAWNIYTDGLTVHTTLDSRLQAYATQSLQDRLAYLQPRLEKDWRGIRKKRLSADLYESYKRDHPQWTYWQSHQYAEHQIDSLFQIPHARQIFSWKGWRDSMISLRDSIIHRHMLLQGGMLVLAPETGHILAWVGGIDHAQAQFDHVLSRRQSGSVFKPIIYGAALHHGISPCTYIENKRIELARYPHWSPDNADNLYGGRYSMAGALTHSVNVASVQLLLSTGIRQVLSYAHQIGLPADLPAVPSLALGTGEVSLFDMVKVYGAIANGGQVFDPTCISLITNAKGDTLYQSPHLALPAAQMGQEALLLREMLRNVVKKGTARGLRTKYGLRLDLAGKTGTTQRQTDGWFIGMTPKLVAGVWVGADDPRVHFRSMRQGQGAYTALPIVGTFMQSYTEDPAFQIDARVRFPTLPASLRAKLDCPEFDFPLSMEAFKLWWLQQQDSLAPLPNLP